MRITTLLGVLLTTTSCAGAPRLEARQASRPEAVRSHDGSTALAPGRRQAALKPPSGRLGFGKRRMDAAPAADTAPELTALYGN